jgi:hypothetical protein
MNDSSIPAPERRPRVNPNRIDLELLNGAVDIHIHHAPDLYARIQDPIELAEDAKAAGMRAICIKRHNFPTAGLAALTRKIVPDFDVFGSMACNCQVGGVNPLAVEAAIKYGIRQLWMPTIDSANHSRVTGSVGQHGRGLTIKGGISEYALKQPPIELLDANGRIGPELEEVIRLVADADIILNLGHTSFREMVTVAQEAKAKGVRRIVCDHPFFLKLTVEQTIEIANLGVTINYTAGEILPRWWRASMSEFSDAIRRVGVARCVISSDCGQLHNPPMVEALRMTCQLLLEDEFTADEVRSLIQTTPAALLYP